MVFSKFSIKNFKSFREQQEILFSTPNKEKIGSGITYLVGSNNAGKTTLIEALSIRDKRNIKTSERLVGLDPEFTLYEGRNLVRKCELIRSASSTIKEMPVLENINLFEIISSRRHWSSVAGSLYLKAGENFSSVLELSNRQNSLDVASELRAIESNDEQYAKFLSLVQRVLPDFTDFAVSYEDNHYIDYISKSGVRHKTDLLGDGVITVLRILLQFFVERPNAIIIDEPELSLHPSAQRKLLRVIAEYSRFRQVIISTHSPYMISWEYLKNGAVLNRVVKDDDKNTEVFTLSNFEKFNSLVSIQNWKMPYALDDVAKEIFFMEDNVLFLEGQEDVGLLRKEPSLENVNIFGYGVRGCDNFVFAFTLAQDLGYKKVSCILDAGDKETLIKAGLEGSFPTFKVVQWNKKDIRDKEVISTVAKEGYFDRNGNKKSIENLDDFDSKLKEVIDYLL